MHLLAALGHHVIVQPVLCERDVVGAFALGDLGLVVGKAILQPAAMNIERLSQILSRHDRALDVPARIALAPWAWPAQYMFGCGLAPQMEIGRMTLLRVCLDAHRVLQHRDLLAGQLAVIRIRLHRKVHIAVDCIGVPAREQLLDQLNLLDDVSAGARRDVRALDAQGIHILKVTAGVALDHFHRLHLVAPRALEYAVFAGIEDMADIGQVLHVQHVTLAINVAQVTHDDVERHVRLGVPDMRWTIYGWPAHVNTHASLVYRLKQFLLSGQRVVDL